MGQCAYLINYTDLPGCQIVALAEMRPGLAAQVAARYAVPRVYPSIPALLDHADSFDAIIHVNQFQFHGGVVPQLLAAGKPLLTEKPLAHSPDVGRQIVAAARATGTPHYLAYHKRCDHATIAARRLMDQWIDSGAFGRLRYVRIAMPPGDWVAAGFTHLLRSDEPLPAAVPDPAPANMTDSEFRHYTRLVNYYVHQVNLLRHLLGDYAVTQADPSGTLLVARSLPRPGVEPVPAVIEMGTHRTHVDWQESVFIAFEQAWLRIDLPAPLAVNRPGRLTIFRDQQPLAGETVIPDLPWTHAMRQQAAYFVQAVRGEPTPLATSDDGLSDLLTLDQYLRLYLQEGGQPAD